MWRSSPRPIRPMPGSKTLPTCPVCNKPVQLETSKTDEHGHARHEECYIATLHKALGHTRPEIK